MATVLSALSNVLTWLMAHPAEVIMLAGMIASTIQKWLAQWPVAVKVCNILSALGVNLPALLQSLASQAPAAVAAAEQAVEKAEK